jgi:hypothetical protein
MKVMAYDDDINTAIIVTERTQYGTEIDISKRELARYRRYIKERDFWDTLIWHRRNQAWQKLVVA